MGFKYDSSKRRDKNAPQKASGIGMILVFIALGVAIWVGWWLPRNVNLRGYLPIPNNWPFVLIQFITGLAAFILLQFVVVLISGFLFPPPPKDKYDKDGLYKKD